jgi:hypothetical protein
MPRSKNWIVHNKDGMNDGVFYDYHQAVTRAYELNKREPYQWTVTEESKYRAKYLKPVEHKVLARQLNYISNGLRIV